MGVKPAILEKVSMVTTPCALHEDISSSITVKELNAESSTTLNPLGLHTKKQRKESDAIYP